MSRYALLAFLAFLGFLGAVRSAGAQDSTEFVVRLNRLEGVVRQLSGQVEQLQFENRQLKENARKFQEDVEFRFGERGGGRAAPGAAAPPPAAAARPTRRSDTFDADGEPAAPGAPRPLGSTASATPPRGDGIAAILEADRPATPARPAVPLSVNPAEVNGLNPGFGGAAGGRSGSVAAVGDNARGDYDTAYAALTGRRYDEAEMGFRRFLQSHPRDRLVADATFYLGESYLGRNRPREAAEQFLKVSTDHTRSPKAPEALLKLGTSLAALGAKDQACATFAELERKYPNAAASVKQGVDREQKRVRCAA